MKDFIEFNEAGISKSIVEDWNIGVDLESEKPFKLIVADLISEMIPEFIGGREVTCAFNDKLEIYASDGLIESEATYFFTFDIFGYLEDVISSRLETLVDYGDIDQAVKFKEKIETLSKIVDDAIEQIKKTNKAP